MKNQTNKIPFLADDFNEMFSPRRNGFKTQVESCLYVFLHWVKTRESEMWINTTGIHCETHDAPCYSKNATRYHQHTMYVDEESNWVTLCPACAERNDNHWDEMWAEYYSGVL